jgi:hypothetical protein
MVLSRGKKGVPSVRSTEVIIDSPDEDGDEGPTLTPVEGGDDGGLGESGSDEDSTPDGGDSDFENGEDGGVADSGRGTAPDRPKSREKNKNTNRKRKVELTSKERKERAQRRKAARLQKRDSEREAFIQDRDLQDPPFIIGDGAPEPRLSVSEVAEAPPGILRQYFGLATWACVMALWHLLDWCGDLETDQLTYFSYKTTSDWRFDDGVIVREEPKRSTSKAGAGPLDESFQPKPRGKGPAVELLETGAPSREATFRTGRKHKLSNYRVFLFTMCAMFSGLSLTTAAWTFGIPPKRRAMLFGESQA